MTDEFKETQKDGRKSPEDLSAEELRQGHIVLYNRRRKLIFFGGVALLVVVILALRFSG